MAIGNMTTAKVWHVEGLDETFESEADAASASVMMMLEVPTKDWDIVTAKLIENGPAIMQRLGIITDPRNRA